MADIKISEIANKASISDLSNSRYIVSVPSADNTTFSTKYAVGADILTQNGGFIDTITTTSHTAGNPQTFPNFNEDTQVILFFGESRMGLVPLVSSAGSGEQIAGTYGGQSGATVRVYRLTGSPGTVRVQSSASSGDGKRVDFFRFTKSGAGGGLTLGNGGFIDTLTPVSNNGPTVDNGGSVLFPNFDENTQVIFFLGNSEEEVGGIVPLEPSSLSGGNNVALKRSISQPGLVYAKATNSGGNGEPCPVYRFTKIGSNIVSSSVNEQAGTTYTLQASDFGKILKFTSSNAITLTVPHNLVIGFNCTVIQNGLGQITFSDNTSSTLYNRQSHTKTAGQYAVVKLTSCVANQFILSGDTSDS